jgi:hypothetical protein
MTDKVKKSWDEIVEADQRFWVALRAFLAGDRSERLEILRNGLTAKLGTALHVLESVPSDELEDLLPDLVRLAGAVHRHLWHVRKLVVSLPKEKLLAKIEALAEPILGSGDEQEYYRFLELYFQIDRSLTEKLAKRAASSADAGVREAGRSFLEKLQDR